MLTFSNFDRSTLKLFVAAFFVLGGASFATARAQDNSALPGAYSDDGDTNGWVVGGISNMPDAVGFASCTCACDCAGHSIHTITGGPSSAVVVSPRRAAIVFAPNSPVAPTDVSGVFGDPIGTPIAYGNSGDSWLVGEPIDWVADFAELSVNTATSEDMSAEGLAAHPTCEVYDGGRRALIRGAVLHADPYSPAAIAVEVIDNNGRRELHAINAGDGGFFLLDLTVDHAFSAYIAAAGQPDAMTACTRPKIAPAPGLGLGGVAISNSTPDAEITSNVDAALNAYNLF